VLLAVDDEPPALDELAYLLRADPRVAEVRTAVGDQVVTGAVLVVFEDAAAAAPMSADGAP